MQGIVLDIKNKKAIVLKKDGAVIETSNRNYQIGQTVTVDLHRYNKFLLLAACFAFCFVTVLSISGYALYNTPSSYVYVDINPSLRLDINCFEQVIDVVPLNDDASKLMESYTFNSKDTESCINDIVKACEEKRFLNAENNNVELDIVTERSAIKQQVDSVTKVLKEKNLGVAVKNIDKDENSKAISVNTSPKRLKAIEEYTRVFGGTVEENAAKLRGVTTKGIYAQTEARDTSANPSADSDGNKSPSGQSTEPTEKIPSSPSEPNAEKDGNTLQNGDEKPSETQDGQKQESENDEANLNPSPKRLEAIEEYTVVFGGSVEENIAILRDKTVKEIKAEIEKRKQEEQAETDKKNQIEQAETEKGSQKEQVDTESTPSENASEKQDGQKQEADNDKVNLNPSPKRLEAIEEYTRVFGGSVEENTAILRGKTVKEIKAEIENKNQKEQAESESTSPEKTGE